MTRRGEGRRLCGLDECDRVHKGRGLCEMHLYRMQHFGTTDAPKRPSLADRFWGKVDKRGPNECWLWTAAVNEHGYGVMRPQGKSGGPTIKAHRVSLMLAGVDIEGQFVLHSCDNPPCVNPAHLSAGTQKQNVADMVNRQRQPRGSRNGFSKLTERQVAEIRRRAAKGERRRSLADEFEVSETTIYRLANGVGWRHVA
jgi:hypothetical protein